MGLLLLPAIALLALLPRRAHLALRFDEALFFGVGGAVALAAWLGLVLAELGAFSLPLAGGLLGGASLLALLLARGRIGRPLPRWPGLRGVAPAAGLLAVAAALQTPPSEYIVGGRDPGAYVASMAIIARTGHIVYTDPGVLSVPAQDRSLFYRNPDGPDFTWARFMGFHLERPETGRVFPQFFHLFPAFGAYLFEPMGLKGALATPVVFGLLGTFGVFLVGRRLLGEGVALLGTAFLVLDVAQVWFARYPVSEGLSQFLLFLGLLGIALWEETDEDVFGVVSGASFGLTLLARIDAALIVVPLGAWVLVRRAQRELGWRRLAAFVVPFAALALHTALHAATFARRYVEGIATRPYWQQPAWVWIAAATGVVVLCVALDRLGPRLAAALAPYGVSARRAVFAFVCVAALYAYFLRPQLSAWAGADGNPEAASRTNYSRLDSDGNRRLGPDELAATGRGAELLARRDRDGDGTLEREEWKGEPPWPLDVLGFQRLAAHDAQSLVRLGWAVTPLGLVLGLVGLGTLLEEWRGRALPLLLVTAAFGGFYLYKARVFNDYPFAWRRFITLVIPVLLLLAALALARVARGSRRRQWLAGALAALLAAGLVRDTAPIVGHVDWEGSVAFVRDVARRFGPDDALIFEQPRSIHLLSLPLWAAHGVNALQLARFNPDPGQLQHLVESWRHEYRNVYFVHTYNTDLCGLFLQRVEDRSFHSFEWFTYDARPRPPGPRSLYFRVSRVVPPDELQVPPLPVVDVGGSDDFQVSGFHEKEGGEERTFRWSGRCASVYLPALGAGARLTLTAAAIGRPEEAPAEVQVSVGGVALGSFTAGEEWADQTFELPDPLPPGPRVLRLDVPGWRPVDTLPGSRDVRDLGVMLDRIVIEPGGQEGKLAGTTPGEGGA